MAKSILHTLPQTLTDIGSDWFEAPNGYPWYAKICKIINPETYLEIGTRVGYSLISCIDASDNIKKVYWCDNESFASNSNLLTTLNLEYYLSEHPEKHIDYEFTSNDMDLYNYADKDIDLVFIDTPHYQMYNHLLHTHLIKNKKCVLMDDIYLHFEIFDMTKKYCKIIGAKLYEAKTYRGLGIIDFTDDQSIISKLSTSDLLTINLVDLTL